MEEIWKDIDGFEGLYQVSNLGQVKSLNYGNHGYERILTPKVNNCRRLWVELFNGGKKKQFLIHRLVGNAFIPNPNQYPQINHIDENPQNNKVDNLEWCTGEYNRQYYRERHPFAAKVRQSTKKYKRQLDKKILQCDYDGAIVREWNNSREIYLQTGMSDWSISECCRENRRTAYGYIWRFAD